MLILNTAAGVNRLSKYCQANLRTYKGCQYMYIAKCVGKRGLQKQQRTERFLTHVIHQRDLDRERETERALEFYGLFGHIYNYPSVV